MKSLQLFLCITPVCCLLAQTPPPTPQSQPSKTITLPPAPGQPAAAKPPTVTLSAENDTPPAAVPPDTVVLTINGKKITAAQYDHMVEIIPEHM